jgi:DNA-binding NarL/FixJ family response regulator
LYPLLSRGATCVLLTSPRFWAKSWELFPTLTEREREILQWIARGASNHQIAKELALSVKTVSNYVSNIFGKLQVADRAQAIIRARDAGLG